jgi:hypothetical protein
LPGADHNHVAGIVGIHKRITTDEAMMSPGFGANSFDAFNKLTGAFFIFGPVFQYYSNHPGHSPFLFIKPAI